MPSPDWPTQIDYQDALQNPALCFADDDLRASVPDATPLGLPVPITGRFANVYRMTRPRDGQQWAARLFLHDSPERERRYRAFADHLRRLSSVTGSGFPSFLASFDYQAQGIRVRNSWYPLLKMEWVNGVPLNVFVEANLNDAAALLRLAGQWKGVIRALKTARIAHGDLQHDNILVESGTGRLRLLDYDGVYVPALAGRGAHEMGHPSYQHPRRMPGDFGPEMDRFPALVIYVALRALAIAPELWYRLDNADNLLFRVEDFTHPDASRAFALLRSHLRAPEAADARRCAEALQAACAAPAFACPYLDTVLPERREEPGPVPPWLEEYEEMGPPGSPPP